MNFSCHCSESKLETISPYTIFLPRKFIWFTFISSASNCFSLYMPQNNTTSPKAYLWELNDWDTLMSLCRESLVITEDEDTALALQSVSSARVSVDRAHGVLISSRAPKTLESSVFKSCLVQWKIKQMSFCGCRWGANLSYQFVFR